MRKLTTSLLFVIMAVFGISAALATDLDTEYLMALSDYYDMPYEMAFDVSEIGVQTEDVPVVFSLAGKAGSDPRDIAKARVKGETWQSICEKNELNAGDFYVMVSGNIVSKTFTPIFEKFKNVNQDKWNGLKLTDEDYINLVNLKFIYSHYDYSVYHVMAMRDYQKTYPKISNKIYAAKEAQTKKALVSKDK